MKQGVHKQAGKDMVKHNIDETYWTAKSSPMLCEEGNKDTPKYSQIKMTPPVIIP